MYIMKKSRFTRRIITGLGTEIANAVIAAGTPFRLSRD
jgi:hypothetical protein